MLEKLKEEVLSANLLLPKYNLVTFTWGENAYMAVHNAVVLEEISAMNYRTLTLNPSSEPVSQVLMDKHYLRKHGSNAYYGQKAK